MVQMKSALAGIPVGHAMLKSFETLAPGDSLSRAVEITLQGSQKDFPVVERGEVVGMLTQERLLTALARDGAEVLVESVHQAGVLAVDSHEMLDGSLARLGSSDCNTIPVTHNGELVGVLTLDNVGELVQIQAALTGRAKRGPGLSRGPTGRQGFWGA